jgi:tetratricopeptide (TPR) repeat protein
VATALSRESLLDEIALREASLADAKLEHERGDLDDATYRAIVARESTALVRARSQLDAAQLLSPKARRRRRLYLVVAGASFAFAILVVLWSAVVPRQAGNSITGAPVLGHAAQITQLLSQAEADTANNNLAAALAAYQGVLAIDPTNVVALTQSGWIDFSAGSARHSVETVNLGLTRLRHAIEIAPREPAAHLYYAIAAASTAGNDALARTQLREFLALHPSKALLAVAQPFLRRLHVSL